MTSIRQIAAAAALATTAALAATAPSAEAAVPCFKTYAGAGSGWKVQNDGSLMQSLQNTGSAMDAGHGRLTVGGEAYPALVGDHCGQTATAMSFPARSVGGFVVARNVSETGGKLRWVDTITNTGAGQVVSVDFDLEVLASQVIVESESGNTTVNADDHWSVHQSQTLFSTHQWGQDGAVAQPEILSEDGGDIWHENFGTMDDDAQLRYSFFIGANQTVRLLHGAGTAASKPAAVASAQDAAGLFAGFTRALADDIVNFGDDPDGDGVTKFVDDCPSVKGDGADGCAKPVILPPADPQNPDAPDAQPDAQPQQTPGQPAAGGAAADTTPPGIAISKIGSKLRRSTLTGRRGANAAIACTEQCRVVVKVVVKRRGSKRERTVQTISHAALSDQPRALRLKVKASSLRRLAKQRVTIVAEATDRAGNRSVARRTISLR